MTTRQQSQYARYGFKDILTGSDLSTRRLALMEMKSIRPGPTVWLTAAIHGDEVGGIVVVHEVFRQLRAHPLKRGIVKAMPLMNPIGFETNTRRLPVSEEDLNRSFPGDTRGRLSERIASKIFGTITESRPALVIDFHNDWIKSIPYLLVDPLRGTEYRAIYKGALELAHATGLVIVEERERDKEELKKTLSGSLMNAGIPAFTIELGESYVVNEADVQNGVAAAWNVLAALSMVDPLPQITMRIDYPPAVRKKTLRYGDRPHSKSSGVIRFLARPGTQIAPGQPLARIYNVFGKPHETVRAEDHGVLLGYTDSAMVFPGMPLVALGVLPHEHKKH